MSDGEWRPDPDGRHQYRWFDGADWTDHVSNDGVASSDPRPPTSPPPVEPPGMPAAAASPPYGATFSAPVATIPTAAAPVPSTGSSRLPLVLGALSAACLVAAGVVHFVG